MIENQVGTARRYRLYRDTAPTIVSGTVSFWYSFMVTWSCKASLNAFRLLECALTRHNLQYDWKMRYFNIHMLAVPPTKTRAVGSTAPYKKEERNKKKIKYSWSLLLGLPFDGNGNQDESYIKIYLKSTVKYKKTVYDFGLMSMIAEIGGTCGLLLGMSVMDITHMLNTANMHMS